LIFGTGCNIGCKPDLPVKSEYEQNDPCFYYDKCIVLNGWTEVKQDCTIVLQKCLRYTDMKKCNGDKDCWEKVGIRY
jgi:hypothetical protein